MSEPQQLTTARRCLARAEAAYRSAGGLADLEQALALLEEVMTGGIVRHRTVAENLAVAYSTKIYERIRALIEADPAVPEPALEHCFKIVLAFDQLTIELPAGANALKVAVVRRLIDRYYEGHPPERKRRALEQLAAVSGSSPGSSPGRESGVSSD
jgi:hypothetical protein